MSNQRNKTFDNKSYENIDLLLNYLSLTFKTSEKLNVETKCEQHLLKKLFVIPVTSLLSNFSECYNDLV